MLTKEYRKEVRDRFNARHPKKTTEYHRLRKFGLSSEAFEKMLSEQNGCCAICGERESSTRNGIIKALAVDHSRSTGKIRKLLCSKCNTGLGLFRERLDLLEAAKTYLHKYY